MLYEIKEVKSYKNEFKRRWFFDHNMDLTIWLDENGKITGFQLCYDKPKNSHAFSWWEKTGYYHHRIDDGERLGTLARKGIPILMLDGFFDKVKIVKLFQEKSKEIDPEISTFVYRKIMQFISQPKHP